MATKILVCGLRKQVGCCNEAFRTRPVTQCDFSFHECPLHIPQDPFRLPVVSAAVHGASLHAWLHDAQADAPVLCLQIDSCQRPRGRDDPRDRMEEQAGSYLTLKLGKVVWEVSRRRRPPGSPLSSILFPQALFEEGDVQ